MRERLHMRTHPFAFLPFLQHLPVEAQLPAGQLTNAPGRLIAGFQSYIAQWDGEGRPGLRGSAMPTIFMVRVKSSRVQEDTVALEVYMNCFLRRDLACVTEERFTFPQQAPCIQITPFVCV